MKKRGIRLFVFALILMMLLSACVPASSEDKTPTDDESSENSQDSTDNNQDDGTDSKEVEFIVAVSTDLVSFDLMNTSAGATNQILYHVDAGLYIATESTVGHILGEQ